MAKVEAIGSVKDGVLTIVNRKRLQQELTEMKDCEVNIIIKKRGKRGNQFNRYYFGCVLKEIQVELRSRGYRINSIEDLHLMMKLKFCNEKVISEEGELILEIPGHTSEMNNDEFGEYVEQVREWASQVLGIYIQEPNEQAEIWKVQ